MFGQLRVIKPRNAFSISWPPGGTGDLTVVYGTAGLSGGTPPPPNGTLQITNTAGNDAAYAYFNSINASPIVASKQTVTAPVQVGATGVNGLFCRAATLNASPPVLFNGYRLDFFTPNLRLIRFDSGSVGHIVQLNLTGFDSGYYTNANNPFTFHLHDAGPGNLMEGFLTAPGRLTTGSVSATGANTSSHTSGKIGFLMFQNLPGPGPGVFSAYTAQWTT